MLKISGLLAGLLLLAGCASTKSELVAVRCDETIQGVGRDLSNGQQKIIYELEKTENANYLLDRDRQGWSAGSTAMRTHKPQCQTWFSYRMR